MKTKSPPTPASTRRSFFGRIAGSAAALTILTRGRAQPAPRKLGIALAGLGGYATGQLAPALRLTQHVELRGVITGSPDKGRQWARDFGFPENYIYHYDKMSRLADNRDIDIVYVVTPNALHLAHASAAAWAGKHVICEKPLALTVSECDAMLAACRTNRVKLSVGYRLQFEPHYDELKRLARDGDFGRLAKMSGGLSFKMTRPQWRAERKLAGGGPLMDLGIYAVQAACMAAGGVAPIAITARELPKQRPEFFRDVEETIEWTMEFARGERGDFSTSYNQGLDRFRAEGDKGWIEIAPAFQYGGLKAVTSRGPFTPAVPPSQQAVQIDDFARCIREDRESPVSGAMGRRDMVILEAIYASAAQGGKRIEVRV
ncbi:MAG: Gfo/Idh/MocA family oxidoreductase [Opitutaceae bacterium]|nr:Gfo/Idh/MocA family oxidoreductase [Opitutaceae bacterium]